MTYQQFSVIATALEKADGIKTVNSDEFAGNAGTLIVGCELRTKEVIQKVIGSNSGFNFEIENTSSTGANLIVKAKKK